MHPYRSAPEAEGASSTPFGVLVVSAIVSWAILVHGIGRLAGRW